MCKKNFIFVLVLMMFLSLYVTGPVYAADSYIPFYDIDIGVVGPNELYPNDGKYDIVGSANIRDTKFSVKFNSSVPFKGVKMFTHGANTPVDISLYAWDTDYETTIANTPILSENSTVGGWNYANHIFEAGEQAAGMYLLQYTGSGISSDGPGQIWRFRTVSKNIKQYLDDKEVTNGTFEGGLIVSGNYTRSEVFVAMESYIPFFDGDISNITEPAALNDYDYIALKTNKLSVAFNTLIPFNGLKMYVDGSANSNKIKVSLYAWDVDYATSISSSPLLTETAAFGDWFYKDYIFVAGQQAAGQYVLVFEWQEGTDANIHRHNRVSSDIQMYVNDELIDNGTYEGGLLLAGSFTRDQVFSKLDFEDEVNPPTSDFSLVYPMVMICVLFAFVLLKKRASA